MIADTPPALIYVSSRRYLYLGQTQLRIRELHSAASSLLICLAGSVRFRTAADDQWTCARSLLIQAGSRIAIDNQGAVMAACYLDAGRPDFLLLKKQMRSANRGIYYHHAHEQQLIEDLTRLRDDQPAFAEAQRRAEQILYAHAEPAAPSLDPRVAHVVERLRDTSALNLSVSSLASEVGLSESGLIRLFSLHVGVPLRRHRLWYRLIEFITLSLSGVASDVAIRAAGFTDAAHLSRCYSGFFGVNLSYAFSRHTRATYIVEALAPSAGCRQNLLLPLPDKASRSAP